MLPQTICGGRYVQLCDCFMRIEPHELILQIDDFTSYAKLLKTKLLQTLSYNN